MLHNSIWGACSSAWQG